MSWWCKARRVPMLAAALGCYLLLLVVVGGGTVALPGIDGVANVLLTVFLAILPAAALAAGLEARLGAAEVSGVRRTTLLDSALSLAMVLGAASAGLVAYAINGANASLAAGRNVAFLVGLTLLARALAGQAAVLATVLWPACVAMFGLHGVGVPYHWTILPERAGAWWAALGAALALLCGLVAQLLTSRRQPS